jgi:anti-sigma factor ChrR (cupin superfamily)
MAAGFDKWIPHEVPGIRVRVLSMNRGYATLLLDVEPGTRFPPHHHGGAEECYVLSGSLFTWGRRLGPGEFLHAEAGTDHSEMWTEEGCQVLLVVPPEDYLPALPGERRVVLPRRLRGRRRPPSLVKFVKLSHE